MDVYSTYYNALGYSLPIITTFNRSEVSANVRRHDAYVHVHTRTRTYVKTLRCIVCSRTDAQPLSSAGLGWPNAAALP